MLKISRLGLVIEGLSIIAILICVFISKPVSDIWFVLLMCGTFFSVVPEIIGAIKRKEKSNIGTILILLIPLVIFSLLMML